MSKELIFGEAVKVLEDLKAKLGRDPELLEALAEGYNYALKTEGYKICPSCGKAYKDYPAISRKDNKTEICPECGQAEAFNFFAKGATK